MAKPKKLTIVGGKRVMVGHGSRQEEYQDYNKMRWKYDRETISFYNSKLWRETSKQVLLQNDYVCCICGGEATETDHIVPVRRDWNKRLDWSNLQPICGNCHKKKTIRESHENRLEHME